jgi:hypothetical protein
MTTTVEWLNSLMVEERQKIGRLEDWKIGYIEV